MYVIDEKLTAYSTQTLLEQRVKHDRIRSKADLIQANSIQGDRDTPIPITTDGTIAAGALYPSSTDASVRYYLPRYQLYQAQGLHTTRLRWRSPHDPNGAIAHLTIELSPQIPAAQNVVLQEIAHQATVRIRYHIPVAQTDSNLTMNVLDRWVGEWRNLDANTSGMTKLEITKLTENLVNLRGYGKCHPTDCDWGIIPAQLSSDRLVGTYDFGWKQTRIVATRSTDQLIVETVDDYTEADGRSDRTSRYVMSRAAQPAQNSTVQAWLEVGALERVSADLRRCQLAIHDKTEFDRIFQIMTDPAFNAQLEIRCFATVGHRTWRQVVDRVNWNQQVDALTEKQVFLADTIQARSPKPIPIEHSDRPPIFRPNLPRQLRDGGLSEVKLMRSIAPLNAAQTVNLNRAQRAAIDSATLLQSGDVQQLVKPDYMRQSDLRLKRNGVVSTAVPIRAILDRTGRPALLRIAVETTQEISFFFVKETNAYLFDIPEQLQPTTHHVLLPCTVHDENGNAIGEFYQDSAFRNQFYYEPEEFRLSRQALADDSLHYPGMIITLLSVTTEAESGTADYQARLSYEALPYINPIALRAAAKQFAEPGTTPRFTAIEPIESKLVLRLPADSNGGALQDIERPQVTVHLDEGILDEVDLSDTQFEQIFAAFHTGEGVQGYVQAKLFDGRSATIPVSLSLKETASPLFDFTFNGLTETAGLYRVTARNRIESPVRITGLKAISVTAVEPATAGVVAYPQTEAGIVVQPGQSVPLVYQVRSDVAVLDIVPIVTTQIEVAAASESLWRRLFVNRGYTSDTFKVQVSIDPSFFASTPAGMQPLTGVQVNFDCGTAIALTPDRLSQEVTLRMPLLPRLMNDPKAMQYQYQVTNLHADGLGNTSGWVFSDRGTLPLHITPAQ